MIEMPFEIKEEPRLEWSDLVGGGIICLGFFFFIIAIHLLAITATDADVTAVLNTVFIVFLYIYIAMIVFALVGIIVQILRWLTWVVTTPRWEREEKKRSMR